jgi:hypothetical protein
MPDLVAYRLLSMTKNAGSHIYVGSWPLSFFICLDGLVDESMDDQRELIIPASDGTIHRTITKTDYSMDRQGK